MFFLGILECKIPNTLRNPMPPKIYTTHSYKDSNKYLKANHDVEHEYFSLKQH